MAFKIFSLHLPSKPKIIVRRYVLPPHFAQLGPSWEWVKDMYTEEVRDDPRA